MFSFPVFPFVVVRLVFHCILFPLCPTLFKEGEGVGMHGCLPLMC